jgi:hypothetical protein
LTLRKGRSPVADAPNILERFIWQPGDITIIDPEDVEEELEGKALTSEQEVLLKQYQEYWETHSD